MNLKASDIANALSVLERVSELGRHVPSEPAALGTLRAQAFIAGLPLKNALSSIDVSIDAEKACSTSQC